ncbi:MAG: cytoskeleton protein RodZ [Chthoniobacter sp.]|jgi:cytoskeletal protein RodZ|nr:cytoskeleton protein RodZ [Chthoniobacter sp.]
MVESVGKKLNQARSKRGLTVDEAAHATRLRPDKIVALENDDYSRFASNVYAKGMLQIYARFLGVDVSEFASNLPSANPISVEDYQYLSSGAPPRREERVSYNPREERRRPSIGPLIFFVAMVVAAGFGFQVYKDWQRIEPKKAGKNEATPPPETATAKIALPTPAVGPSVATSVAPVKPPPPVLRAEVPPAVEASDREFVVPTQIPAAAPTGANEILVQPIKKTMVTVRKNDPKSSPVFEDYLYPDAPPLKLKGGRFFIEAKDPRAIQLRKNGAPIAYQAPGVEVQ